MAQSLVDGRTRLHGSCWFTGSERSRHHSTQHAAAWFALSVSACCFHYRRQQPKRQEGASLLCDRKLWCTTLLQAWGVPRPGGLLVSGPPGSGKSALVAAAAAALQRHPQCLTYPVVVRCREITAEGPTHVQALISAKVRVGCEAL